MRLKKLIEKKVPVLATCIGVLAMVNFVGLREGNAYEYAIADRATQIKGCEIINFGPLIHLPAPTKKMEEEHYQRMANEVGSFIINNARANKDAVVVYDSRKKKIVICDGEVAVKKLFGMDTTSSLQNVKEGLDKTRQTMWSAESTVNSLRWLINSVKNIGR